MRPSVIELPTKTPPNSTILIELKMDAIGKAGFSVYQMPVDRILWNSPFRKLPRWVCPTCREGHLLEKGKSIHVEETGPSKQDHQSEDWDPEWVTERFAGFLYCNLQRCGEIASISGTCGVEYSEEEDADGQPYQSYASTFAVRYICPSPHLFPVSDKCPDAMRKRLLEAFDLFWSDFDSCANKLRIAVEAMLTERKIAKYARFVSGRPRKKLSLHARIGLYRAKNTEAADCLEAIKWLGNYGSHDDTKLKLEDVLIAADLLEHVVNLTYNKTSTPLTTAQKINQKKGPIQGK